MKNTINIVDINIDYLRTHSAIPFTLNKFIKKDQEVYSWSATERFYPEEMQGDNNKQLRIDYFMNNVKTVGLDELVMADQPKGDNICHELTFEELSSYFDSDKYKKEGTIWNIEKKYTALFMTKETHDKIKEKYNRSVSLVFPVADCAAVRYYDKEKEVVGLVHSDGYFTGQNIANDMTKFMNDHFHSNTNDIEVFVGAFANDNWIYDKKPVWAINKDKDGNFLSYRGEWDKYIDEISDNRYEIHYGDYLYNQIVNSGIDKKKLFFDPNNTIFNKNYFSNSRAKTTNEKEGRNLVGITFDKEIVNKVENTEIKLR
ncbi:MAG: laccase domain-containing protein [Bacilli bacterium]|nr:laccase domain-containing protein [Bacilli bacterium]